MTFKLGYLLPTREQVMADQHDAARLLSLAGQADALGFDSLWVGDSLLARPRHDPLTLLGAIAVAAPNAQIGTAVLLPMLRNPVVLAQQLATLDQISAGRLVVGAGIAADNPAIRAEFLAAGVPFEKRVGRLLEGFRLCRALWSGEPVDWQGRWELSNAVLAPRPYTPDGPPIWLAASVPAGIKRAAQHFEGWFPIGPEAQTFGQNNALYTEQAAAFGKPATTAIYLTVSIAANAAQGEQAIDNYLAAYYNIDPAIMRRFQACCGGDLQTVLGFISSFIANGADHVVLRLVGEHESQLQMLAEHRDLLSSAV
ncbi:MAG: LLM class flavin-dependent oxidoreductase [Pseudomonadota bacterium]